MSVIAISQSVGSLGDEIGAEVARILSYEFVDREIVLKATERFAEGGMDFQQFEHVTEEKPTLWERFSEATQRYMAYIEAILLELAARDNVVLSGRGAPFVLCKVRHALRVRITAPEGLRVSRVEHQQGLATDAALRFVRHSDQDRAARIRFLYHADWDDPLLYDLVLNTERLTAREAARLIQEGLQNERVRPTVDSRAEVMDLSFTAWAKAALLAHPMTRRLQVSLVCEHGHVTISGMVEREEERKVAEEIVAKVPRVIGVRNEIELVPRHLIPE